MKIRVKRVIGTVLFSIMALCFCFFIANTFYVKADQVYTTGTALNESDYCIRGGSIRYDSGRNDNGMRIHIKMSKSYFASLGAKESGVLIIPEYLLDGELGYDTENVLDLRFAEKDFDAISAPGAGDDVNDKEVLADLIFTQDGEPVSSKIYNAVFCVRGYIVDGSTIRYTSVWKKSIADVALAFIDDPSQAAHAEELDAYLNTYQVKFFEEDGKTQIGATQNVKYGSTFNIEDPSNSRQYSEYKRRQTNGSFASENYDFSAEDATVVKKNIQFKVTVNERTITFPSGITVKNSSGTTITSGASVLADTYTATASCGKGSNVYIKEGDETKAAAVGSTGTYTFYLGNETKILTRSSEFVSTDNTYENYIYSSYTYVSDPSIYYENGKYYMTLMTNCAKHFPEIANEDGEYLTGDHAGESVPRIIEMFEADNLNDLLDLYHNKDNSAKLRKYLVMDPYEMKDEIYDKCSCVMDITGGCYAPELQKIGDYYYITTAYLCNTHSPMAPCEDEGHRATMILRSESLTSGWQVWAPHIDTPFSNGKTWNAIDGVLYEEYDANEGRSFVYLIVSHTHQTNGTTNNGKFVGGTYEWTRLNDNLTQKRSESSWHTMFNAKTVLNANGYYHSGSSGEQGKISDAPHLYKNSQGDLLFFWTSDWHGYSVFQSKSSNGSIRGTWSFQNCIYDKNVDSKSLGKDDLYSTEKVSGGHTGFVETPEGQLYMTMHTCMWEESDPGHPTPEYAKRLAVIAMKENPTTHLIEWGVDTNNKYIEIDSTNTEVELANNINCSNYKAEFTVKRDYVDGNYIGFCLYQGDSYYSKLLLKTYNGRYYLVGDTPSGHTDTIGTPTSIVINSSDLVKLTITCTDGEKPKVFVNDVYNSALTTILGTTYQSNVPLKEISIVGKDDNAKLTRVFKWSFATGGISTPQKSELHFVSGVTVTLNSAAQADGAKLNFGSTVNVAYTNSSNYQMQVYANDTLLGTLNKNQVLNANYVVDSLVTNITVKKVAITLTYNGNISIVDSSDAVIESGASLPYNTTVKVTLTNNDKAKIARLYINGVDSGIVVVNAVQTFVFTIEETTHFSLVRSNYSIHFDAASSNQATKEAVAAKTQGIDGDGYLAGPNIDKYSFTQYVTLAKDAVFTTTLKLNRGYMFGVKLEIGDSDIDYRILARPWFRVGGVGDYRPEYIDIWKGIDPTSGTHYKMRKAVLNDEITIKLIFDSTNEKVYVIVNGEDFTDRMNIEYSSDDIPKIQFYYCCETDETAGVYKTWSVLSGADVVARAIEELNAISILTNDLFNDWLVGYEDDWQN